MNGRTIAEDMEREYQRQSLRDTFAAAALTGMLGSGDLVIDPRNGTATTLTVLDAYRWADAMLRERDRQPAPPCVETDRHPCDMQSPAAPAGSGEDERRDVPHPDTKGPAAGGPAHHTPEPVAWAVASIANNDLRTFHKSREDAESQIAESVQLGIVRYADTMRVVPLYRQSQDWAFLNNEIVRLRLTDAERAAVAYYVGTGGPDAVDATLRGLLERLA